MPNLKRLTKASIWLSMKRLRRIRCHRRLKPSVLKNTKLSLAQKPQPPQERRLKTQSLKKIKMTILFRRPRKKLRKLF